MINRELNQDGFRVWHLAAGTPVGVVATVAVYSIAHLYTVTGYCVDCSAAQTARTILFLLVWAAGAVGSGALAGRLAGRLEVPVAIGSGITGLIILGYLPDSFADPAILLVSSIPFLLFVAVGGMLVFFARRTDLR